MAITHTNAMLDATGKWSAQEQQRQLWSVTEWSFPVHHNIHNQLHIHNSQRHDSTNDQFCNSQCTQHSGVCCMADVYRFLTFLSIRITTTTWITTSTMTTTTTTTSCSSSGSSSSTSSKQDTCNISKYLQLLGLNRSGNNFWYEELDLT